MSIERILWEEGQVGYLYGNWDDPYDDVVNRDSFRLVDLFRLVLWNRRIAVNPVDTGYFIQRQQQLGDSAVSKDCSEWTFTRMPCNIYCVLVEIPLAYNLTQRQSDGVVFLGWQTATFITVALVFLKTIHVQTIMLPAMKGIGRVIFSNTNISEQ